MKLPFQAKTLGADLISVSSHKVHGPKGAGALYIRRGLPLPPLLLGGGQEGGYRSGTEATPALVGFGAACTAALPTLREDLAREAALRDRCAALLEAIPGVELLGAREAPHILLASIPGVPTQIPSISCRTMGSASLPVPPVPRGTGAMCWRPWAFRRRWWMGPSESPSAVLPPKKSWRSWGLGCALWWSVCGVHKPSKNARLSQNEL